MFSKILFLISLSYAFLQSVFNIQIQLQSGSRSVNLSPIRTMAILGSPVRPSRYETAQIPIQFYRNEIRMLNGYFMTDNHLRT